MEYSDVQLYSFIQEIMVKCSTILGNLVLCLPVGYIVTSYMIFFFPPGDFHPQSLKVKVMYKVIRNLKYKTLLSSAREAIESLLPSVQAVL